MNIEINVPDGISGEWKVESFSISKQDAKFANMRALFQGGRGALPPGNYKKLTRNGSMVMSNTPDEIRDFSSFAYRAQGHILINGLGIGVLIKALLEKEDVLSIDIIEKSEDVIKLSGPTYSQDKRVTIINANAFDYMPPLGVRYNYVWHDIWDEIDSENLPEMHKLHRKYGRKADYQESWCRYQCEQQKKQDRYY